MRSSCRLSTSAGVSLPDINMKRCYSEESAEVPATAQDFLDELPSRCTTEQGRPCALYPVQVTAIYVSTACGHETHHPQTVLPSPHAGVPASPRGLRHRAAAVRFRVEEALLSARPRVGGLTVVVSGALNRLHMVEATCAAWAGPLAVAVLLPVLPPGVQNAEDADGRMAGTALRPVTPCRPPLDSAARHFRLQHASLGCDPSH